jgi:hypothetical protein
LTVYPKAWRHLHEDELVAVLMDISPPGRARPSVGEVSDLVFHGVGTRWRSVAEAPTGRLYRQGIGLAGLAALTLLAALGLATLLAAAVHPASLTSSTRALPIGVAAAACFVATFGSAVAGRRTWALAACLLGDAAALSAAVVVAVGAPAEAAPRPLPLVAGLVLALEATGYVLIGHRRTSTWSSMQRRAWLAICAGLVGVVEIVHPFGTLNATHGIGDPRLLRWGLTIGGVLVGVTATAALIEPRVLIAVLTLAIPLTPLVTIATAHMAPAVGHGPIMAAVLLVVVALAAHVRWTVHRKVRTQTS